ncbi:MAG: hypothetical protein J6K16_00790 [Alphaproteobacteria bacterium]|nr:hypothetical protein [Alphaproteobacteria bacterium]
MKRYFIFYVLFFFIGSFSSYAQNDSRKALIEIMETIRITETEIVVGNENMTCYREYSVFPHQRKTSLTAHQNRIKISKWDYEAMKVKYNGKMYRILFYLNNNRLTVLVGRGKTGKSYVRSFELGKKSGT